MTEKLSDRLRAYAENCATIKGGADLIAAAAALDAKDAEIARLKEALARIYRVGDGYSSNPDRHGEPAGTTGEGHAECREIARAALDRSDG